MTYNIESPSLETHWKLASKDKNDAIPHSNPLSSVSCHSMQLPPSRYITSFQHESHLIPGRPAVIPYLSNQQMRMIERDTAKE
jgi:hypothetical protein